MREKPVRRVRADRKQTEKCRMNLYDKLARLDRSLQKQKAQVPSRKTSAAGDLPLPGGVQQGAEGTCWLARRDLPLSHSHAQATLEALLHQDGRALQYLTKNPAFAQIRLDRLLFLDTETTGLSGGVGTVAFLVGLGFFAKGRFVSEQWLMRDFSEERALLAAVLGRIRECVQNGGAIISFNGKTYDIPLLVNRAVYHRLLREDPAWPHVDLLHPARRLWKKSLPDCSLATLEARVLAVQRRGDVPGYLIPQRYFEFLRTRDPRPLLPVFYHNRMDLLSLTALLNRLLRLFARREPFHNNLQVDYLAMGAVYEEVRDFRAGEEHYRALLRGPLPLEQKKQAALRLARIHKRKRNWDQAVSLWLEALRSGEFSVEPYEELAKVYEHHIRDLLKARRFTEKALENVRLLEQLRGSGALRAERERLEWRLARLNRKLARAGGDCFEDPPGVRYFRKR